MTDWTIILRSLTGRLFSTVTTVITVAVAVGLMLVLLMMRDSGRKAFERGSGNMHLLVSADASPLVSVLNGIYYANPPRRPVSWQKYQEIAGKFPLEFAIPTQIGDSYRGQPVLATTPEFFTKFQPTPGEPWRFAHGAGLKDQWDLVVGSRAARATGLKIGDRVHLTHGSGDSRAGGAGGVGHEHEHFDYTVVGVLGPTGSAHDRAIFSTVEAAWLIHAFDRIEREEAGVHAEETEHDHDHVTLPTLDDLTEEDRKITGVYLRLITREGSDAPANLPQIFDILRRDSSITVAQPDQEIKRLFAIVGNVDQILLAMAGVVMVSSGIAIMLALYNSMEQRRRQIAVLRVLGCSRGRIFGLVVTESAVLGMAGAAVGLVASVLGARVVAGLMKERLGLVIDPGLAYEPTAIVLAATVALASLAGIIPAAMAYNTSVAKNLKPLG